MGKRVTDGETQCVPCMTQIIFKPAGGSVGSKRAGQVPNTSSHSTQKSNSQNRGGHQASEEVGTYGEETSIHPCHHISCHNPSHNTCCQSCKPVIMVPVIVGMVPVVVIRIVQSMIRSVVLVSTSVSITDPVTRMDSVIRRRGLQDP